MTLRGLMRHLARLDLETVAQAARAEAIAAAAREAGTGGGEVRADQTEPLVGWRSGGLRRRERGDAGARPCSVLAPVAAERGARVAQAVGAAVSDALQGA